MTKIKTSVEAYIPLIEDILGEWKNELGGDFTGYKNHVYRMVNFCFAQNDFDADERKKIIVAGCFHDLGIWSHKTFDYLPPSVELLKSYLTKNELQDWIPETASMIAEHHKIHRYGDSENSLVEIFRQGDLVDFSLGIIKCGLPKSYIGAVKTQFPNAGFHKCLLKTAAKWIVKHPFNPVPVLKW